jgi:hypothetical protein
LTILNLFVDGTRALIGVDTLAYSSADASVLRHPDGMLHEIEKAVVLNRARCVLAMSGLTNLLHYLHSRGARIGSMDEALIELPRLLRVARQHMQLTGPTRGNYPRDRVIVAGWSDTMDRVIAAIYESRNGFETFDTTVYDRGGQGHLAPGVSMLAHPMPDDVPNMVALAHRQCAEYRKDNPAAPFGGRLVVLEVDRECITSRNLADLGMPAKLVEAEAGEPMQIAAEAATEIITGALQAGPFNGGTGSIAGSLVTVGTYATAVRVVVHISGDYSAPNGTGGALVARSNFGLSDSVTGGMATGNTKIVRAQVPAGETFAVPLYSSAEFALAAGDSITVGVYFSDHASATANGSLSNVRTRVEVIKR